MAFWVQECGLRLRCFWIAESSLDVSDFAIICSIMAEVNALRFERSQ